MGNGGDGEGREGKRRGGEERGWGVEGSRGEGREGRGGDGEGRGGEGTYNVQCSVCACTYAQYIYMLSVVCGRCSCTQDVLRHGHVTGNPHTVVQAVWVGVYSVFYQTSPLPPLTCLVLKADCREVQLVCDLAEQSQRIPQHGRPQVGIFACLSQHNLLMGWSGEWRHSRQRNKPIMTEDTNA